MTKPDNEDLEGAVRRSLRELFPVEQAAEPQARSATAHPKSAAIRPRNTAVMVVSGFGLVAAAAAVIVAVNWGGNGARTPDGVPPAGRESSAGTTLSDGPSHSVSHVGPSAAPSSIARILDERYRLFIHCGVPTIDVAGRAWVPVTPVPSFPGRAAVNGTTTDDGYTTGVLRRIDATTLQFNATDSRKPFTVTFKPASPSGEPSTSQVCA